jgi:hypothetical protein
MVATTSGSETVLYTNPQIKITNERVVVRDTIYALARITAVRFVDRPPSYSTAWLLLGAGAVLAASFGMAFVLEILQLRYVNVLMAGLSTIGVLIAISGAIKMRHARTTYAVKICSSFDEGSILVTEDLKYIPAEATLIESDELEYALAVYHALNTALREQH